jgi:hypothetical protein
MSKFDICLLKVLGQAVLKQKFPMGTFTIINKFCGHTNLKKTKLFKCKNNPVKKPVTNLKIETNYEENGQNLNL